MMKLRRARPNDEAAVTAVLTEAYSRLLAKDYDVEQLAKAMPLMGRANPTLLSSGSYYVVEVEGEIAACGGWTLEAPGTGEVEKDTGHIRHFATHPDLLRQGAAGIILRHCIDEARKSAVRRLFASSTLTAQPFYAAYGFRRIRPADMDLGQGIQIAAVNMRLDLI